MVKSVTECPFSNILIHNLRLINVIEINIILCRLENVTEMKW